MKTTVQSLSKKWLAVGTVAAAMFVSGNLSAQTHQERVYATAQGSAVSGLSLGNPPNVANPTFAITPSITDSSVLNTGSGSLISVVPTITYYLSFGSTIAANTPVHLKLSLPAGLLNAAGLLGNITVGSFTSLSGAGGTSASATGTTTLTSSSNGLLNLLPGVGTDELVVTPTSSFQGVYIQLQGLLSAGSLVNTSMSVFYAYYFNTVSGAAGAPKPIDLLSGSQGSVTGTLGTVSNNWNAIDGDENTAATLSAVANVASSEYLTAIFNTPAKSGDSVRLVVDNPNGGLLNLSLLGGLNVQPYNGTTAVGSPIVSDASLLNIQLLPGSTTKNVITVPVTAAGTFDRVQVTYGGLADLSSLLGNGTLNVYEVGVVIPAPTVSTSSQYVYSGNTFSLSATANASGDPIIWHDSTGSTVSSTTSITAPTVSSTTPLKYYTLSSRDGDISESDSSLVTVYDLPAGTAHAPANSLAANTAYSDNAIVTPSPDAAAALPNTPDYVYSVTDGSLPDGVTLNSDGTITGTPTTPGTYSFTVHVVDAANGNMVVGDYPQTFTVNAALAVDLKSFGAAIDAQKDVVLTWTTASEQNEAKFDVQSSSDGQSFSTIGSVKASGTTSDAHTYDYTDKNAAGLTYYRLEEIDNAGNVIYSNVINIDNGKQKSTVSISPNPATTKITIGGNVAQVNIYDAAGRLVLTDTKSQIDVTKLLRGIYFVTIKQQDGTIIKTKFIKE